MTRLRTVFAVAVCIWGSAHADEISELTRDGKRADGLISTITSAEDGKVRLLLSPDDFGQEYIHAVFVLDAPIVTGYFRGASLPLWDGQGLITLRRTLDSIDFVRASNDYFVNPASPASNIGVANLSQAILGRVPIEAEDQATQEMLLDISPLILSESLIQLKYAPASSEEYKFGELSGSKSQIERVRTHAENIDIVVRYVYENPNQPADDGSVFADRRQTSLIIQHSLIAVPDNAYQPRSPDPRIGYFVERSEDLLELAPNSWRDKIRRWHLERKEPAKALSEPVQPIVFWIENTTPHEYRKAVRDGALAWNHAFESAGFKNAIEVRIQPDDAEWSVEDIRYNTIRWQVTPKSWFGAGISQTISNPRTGQILAAKVVLDHREVSVREQQGQLYRVSPISESPDRELVSEFVRELTLHEVGHALGLTHNLRGSQLFSPKHLADASATRLRGISGSVMDLLPPNLAPGNSEQGRYHQILPGPYDHWAIEYGYSEALNDPFAEADRLRTLLARSTDDSTLAFGNDADAIWHGGTGIDPTNAAWDLSSDPLRYAADRIDLLGMLKSELLTRYSEAGASYDDLVQAYSQLNKENRTQIEIVSRYIGGIRINRALQGKDPAPYAAIPRGDQERAMTILAKDLFAERKPSENRDLYSHLQASPRGFDLSGKTEDPKILGEELSLASSVLDYLLHPVVLQRIIDSSHYGNQYEIGEMMTDLTSAIFDADMKGIVTYYRQGLQAEYVDRLGRIVNNDSVEQYDHASRAIVFFTLTELKKKLERKSTKDNSTNGHTRLLLHSIDRLLGPTES